MSVKMTREERESFLAGVHIAIIAIADGDRGPLTVPVWYDYEPGGELWLVTSRNSRKGKLLGQMQRFSLCVQSEEIPYKYVSIEGPILSIEPADLEAHFRPLAHRFMGTEAGDAYVASVADTEEATNSVILRMQPERWFTVDYAKEWG